MVGHSHSPNQRAVWPHTHTRLHTHTHAHTHTHDGRLTGMHVCNHKKHTNTHIVHLQTCTDTSLVYTFTQTHNHTFTVSQTRACLHFLVYLFGHSCTANLVIYSTFLWLLWSSKHGFDWSRVCFYTKLVIVMKNSLIYSLPPDTHTLKNPEFKEWHCMW